MSLLKITPKLVWRTTVRYKFHRVPRHITHGLSSGVEQCHLPLVHSTVYYSTNQYRSCPLRHGSKIHKLDLYSVRQFSSAKKPLLFTDNLLQKHIKQLIAEWNQIQTQLSGDQSDTGQLSIQDASKRQHNLEPIISKIVQHQQYSADISELEDIISTSANKDAEICDTAESEIADLKMQLTVLEEDIVSLLLPALVGDDSDIILEVNAGVGGQEAMLFTKEVFHMYLNYASYKGWSANVVNYEETDVGGLRHAVATVNGQNVFLRMKFESGVHRVQRVPKTEKSGRMHTSTVTVAVLPQPSEIDIVLHPKDLRVETCRASGKGGQHVNKTESAVRIVHLPTGMAAECQVERSQISNKKIAMTVLRSRIQEQELPSPMPTTVAYNGVVETVLLRTSGQNLYEKELDKSQQQQSSARKLQVGSARRSEKIRTYNMRDDRVTDHRINENVYGVSRLLDGGKELDVLIDMVQMEARYERLIEQLSLSTQQDIETSSVADTTSS